MERVWSSGQVHKPKRLDSAEEIFGFGLMQTGGSRRTWAMREQNEKCGSQRLGAIFSRVEKFLEISSVEGILVILTKTVFCLNQNDSEAKNR